MRKKIELFGLRMKAAVQSHPVEVSLSVLACAMGCYDYESEGSFFDMVLQYMPVVFLFVYTLNRCCARMRRRLLYYFSALLWIPFLMMPPMIAPAIFPVPIKPNFISHSSCINNFCRIFPQDALEESFAASSAFSPASSLISPRNCSPAPQEFLLYPSSLW